MSFSIQVKYTDTGRAIVVQVQGIVKNPTGLNTVLADRLADELKLHFRRKNAKPNRLGGLRTNYWNGIADDTGVTKVDAAGATLTIANQTFAIHLHGGTIRPKKAKALTVPLVPEAHGIFARTY
jgi:hypothetical protein